MAPVQQKTKPKSKDFGFLFVKKERTCKPGFVVDRHLSPLHVTVQLMPPRVLRRAGADFRQTVWGVASDRVYICTQLPAVPVSSYLAFPSLPDKKSGGLFLLHFPGSRLRRTLSVTLPCEARTFLAPTPYGNMARDDPILSVCHYKRRGRVCQPFFRGGRFPAGFFAAGTAFPFGFGGFLSAGFFPAGDGFLPSGFVCF